MEQTSTADTCTAFYFLLTLAIFYMDIKGRLNIKFRRRYFLKVRLRSPSSF